MMASTSTKKAPSMEALQRSPKTSMGIPRFLVMTMVSHAALKACAWPRLSISSIPMGIEHYAIAVRWYFPRPPESRVIMLNFSQVEDASRISILSLEV